MHSCANLVSDDCRSSQPQRFESGHDRPSIVLQKRHLYGIIALLLMYIVDKKLLILPVVALVLAVALSPLFDPLAFERILDLYAFQDDRSTEENSCYRDITENVPVEEHFNHYVFKTNSTVDQASWTTVPKYAHVQTQTIAPKTSETEHVDQITSTTAQHVTNSSTETRLGVFIPITAAQNEEMGRSQAMRDRVPHAGIYPSQRVVKPVDDNVVHEIDRREIPFPVLEQIKIDQNVQRAVAEEHTFLRMPAPRPGSLMTIPNLDPYRHTRPEVFDGEELIENPFHWAETSRKHICVSLALEGVWLIKTADAEYTCQWITQYQIWWCEDGGFGFHEEPLDDPDTNPAQPYRFFYADLGFPTAEMIGPNRTRDIAGPYWREAVEDHEKLSRKQEAEIEQAEKLEREEAAMKASQEKERRRKVQAPRTTRRHARVPTPQRSGTNSETQPEFPFDFTFNAPPPTKTAEEPEQQTFQAPQQNPVMPKQGQRHGKLG
jgi:hypothetical protein